jgi:Pilus formation protein N terminal region
MRCYVTLHDDGGQGMRLRLGFVTVGTLAVSIAGFVAVERIRAANIPLPMPLPADAPIGPGPGRGSGSALHQAPPGDLMTTDMTSPIQLAVNKAVVFNLRSEVKNVLVGSPDILGVTMRTSRRAYISAIKEGQSNVFFFDDHDRLIGSLDIYVSNRAPLAAPDIVTILRANAGIGDPSYLRCDIRFCTSLPGYTPPSVLVPGVGGPVIVQGANAADLVAGARR